jgi:NAD+ diphosphatase
VSVSGLPDPFFGFRIKTDELIMTSGDGENLLDHRAAFSAAFLECRYPELGSPPPDAKWVIVRENGVYGTSSHPPAIAFFGEQMPIAAPVRTQYLGHQGSTPWYAAEISSGQLLPGLVFYPNVRELSSLLSREDLAAAMFAVRIIDFIRTTRFCGQCGKETLPSLQERARVCPTCGLIIYPRTSPAIIVLVQREGRILLAASPRFPPGLHSILAGFVEPCETLEDAVHREVREETGIEVTNIRYLGSEPWPFPNSLMIGFVADYAGGEMVIDNNEIISAGWFDRTSLPDLPSKISISRSIIDWWIANGERERS